MTHGSSTGLVSRVLWLHDPFAEVLTLSMKEGGIGRCQCNGGSCKEYTQTPSGPTTASEPKDK